MIDAISPLQLFIKDYYKSTQITSKHKINKFIHVILFAIQLQWNKVNYLEYMKVNRNRGCRALLSWQMCITQTQFAFHCDIIVTHRLQTVRILPRRKGCPLRHLGSWATHAHWHSSGIGYLRNSCKTNALHHYFQQKSNLSTLTRYFGMRYPQHWGTHQEAS